MTDDLTTLHSLRNSGASEIEVIDRLERWAKTFGQPIGPGRANPDNDMYYLLTDAAEAIRGLRSYANTLERTLEEA